ncbi:MAG: metallophosphoesterase [Fidelibacterota bacterium]|nr:MAG: metallophosphoesterase [Candidatus Neomarinimicrobiota bacterium]
MEYDRRYIVVGDVHGNWRDTEVLLEKAQYQPAQDVLIFVGDYNDHLPYPEFSVRKLIDQLLEIHHQAPASTFFIRGNHDLWFAEWLRLGGMPPEIWYIQGGRETLASYGIMSSGHLTSTDEKVPRSHKDFICSCVDQYYLDENVVVIHGGFTTEHQMERVSKGEQLHPGDLERIVWDRYFMFSENEAAHAHYHKYFGDRYLITGHTPEGPYVNPCNSKWILVNAASRGERLCAVLLESDADYSFLYA